MTPATVPSEVLYQRGLAFAQSTLSTATDDDYDDYDSPDPPFAITPRPQPDSPSTVMPGPQPDLPSTVMPRPQSATTSPTSQDFGYFSQSTENTSNSSLDVAPYTSASQEETTIEDNTPLASIQTETSTKPPTSSASQTETSTKPPTSPASQTETSTKPPTSPASQTETSTKPPTSPASQTETSTKPPASPASQTETSTKPPASPASQTETSTKPPTSPASQTEEQLDKVDLSDSAIPALIPDNMTMDQLHAKVKELFPGFKPHNILRFSSLLGQGKRSSLPQVWKGAIKPKRRADRRKGEELKLDIDYIPPPEMIMESDEVSVCRGMSGLIDVSILLCILYRLLSSRQPYPLLPL